MLLYIMLYAISNFVYVNKVYECRYHACSKISNRIEVQLTTSLSSSCLTDPWVFVLLASNRREIPVSRPVKLQKWMNMLVSIIIIMLLLIDHRASTYTSTMLSHDTTVIIRVVVLMECRKKAMVMHALLFWIKTVLLFSYHVKVLK